MSAGDIASHFDMSQATVSYHLSLLKDAGLICEEKGAVTDKEVSA